MIDAHHHVWDLSVRDQPWITGPDSPRCDARSPSSELAEVARPAGVEATVLVQTVTVAEETPELLALAAAATRDRRRRRLDRPHRRRTPPTRSRRCANCRRGPLVGIRHQVQDEPDPDWLRRPDVRAGLHAVARAGLVYDLLDGARAAADARSTPCTRSTS